MGAIARITDFIPGTTIISADVDAEFNQLVNLLKGSSDFDVAMRNNHASNPVVNLNQLGAGLIQKWQQNTVDKSRIANDGLFELVNAAGQFPGDTCLYTNTTVGTTITNTTTETSVFTGATASSGSSRTVKANSSRAGTVYRIRMYLLYSTNGAVNIHFRIKFGSVLVVTTTSFAVPNAGGLSGLVFMDAYLYINALGAAGLLRADFEGRISPSLGGIATPTFFQGPNGEPAVDTTIDNDIDVTAQWSAAAASNQIQFLSGNIRRIK